MNQKSRKSYTLLGFKKNELLRILINIFPSSCRQLKMMVSSEICLATLSGYIYPNQFKGH